MVRRKTTTIETMVFDVQTKQEHIDDGECRLANRCMEKLAIAEALKKLYPDEPNNHVRIDAGHIRFNAEGYRWIANTPKAARKALIDFDHKRNVKPHTYTVTAQRTTKIKPNPRARQEQINDARAKRKAAGVPDKDYTPQSLRKRIIGFR